MSKYVSRDEWGARAASGGMNAISSKPDGVAIHWEGTPMGTFPHSECDNRVRSIQSYHMDSNGWSDIAYNLIACPHDYVFEGRGKNHGSAANGTTDANREFYAVCALVGSGDPQPPELTRAIQSAANKCREWGAGSVVKGHRDFVATSCPGDQLYSQVKAGDFGGSSSSSDSGSSGSGSSGGSSSGKGPAFPLPSGHYFGPADGPAASHSGYYSASDREHLATWQKRMHDRGWTITADGLYGPETAGVARSFQAEKGLAVDGLIGVNTWSAAWNAPVT